MSFHPSVQSPVVRTTVLATGMLLSSLGVASALHVTVGSADGVPGGTVAIEVHVDTTGSENLAGIMHDIFFDSSLVTLSEGDCVINPEISSAPPGCRQSPAFGPCKDLFMAVVDCAEELCFENIDDGDEVEGDHPECIIADCGIFGIGFQRMRAIVLALGTLWPIPGGLLYTCTFTIREGANRSANLHSLNFSAADFQERELRVTGSNGRITIPTIVSSPTAAVPTADATAAFTATPTATATSSQTETPQATEPPAPTEAAPTLPAGTPPLQSTSPAPTTNDDDGCSVGGSDNRAPAWWITLLPLLLWPPRRARRPPRRAIRPLTRRLTPMRRPLPRGG